MFSTLTIHILLFGSTEPDEVFRGETFVNPQIVFHRAGTSKDAIERLLEFDMTAIVMDTNGDVSDPFREAVNTAALIRTSEKFRQIPILFLLAQAPEPETPFGKFSEGPVDYMVKPVNRNILSSKIRLFTAFSRFRKKESGSLPHMTYRQFFENSPAAFVIIDKEGFITDINACFIRTIARQGQDKLDYIGKPVFSHTELIHPKVLDMCKSILAGNRPHKTDIVVPAGPFSMNRYYTVSGAPLVSGGTLDGLVLVYEDISERIEVENDLSRSKNELENANLELNRMTENLEKAIDKANRMAVEAEIATISKSIFLASMSHEIRTPLNAVVGFTDLMLSTALSEEQKEYLGHIRDSSQIFLGLINDILDFSKIEANRVTLENIPFNLETEVEEVVSATGLRAYEKNIEIAFSMSPDVPRNVTGDPVRFKQILVNIIGNAVKFTARGHILIRVSLVSRSSSTATLCFSISDTGIGIPSSKLQQIFEPFSQANDSTTREFGGTGLGLAISKKLTDMMNGSIRVESPNPETQSQGGTIFHIELSLDLSIEPALSEIQTPFSVIFFCSDRVLLDFYTRVLSDLGITVFPYESIDTVFEEPEILETGMVSALIVDDSIPLPSVRDLLETRLPKFSFKGNVFLATSPYSQIDKNLHPCPTAFHLFRKPVKISGLRRFLTRSLEALAIERISTDPARNNPNTMPCLRVLLVEDNQINQKVATKMLKKMGHAVILAENGNEALDMLGREKDVDLILMDGQMPVMDGFKATEIIRRKELETPEKTRIPIIALTANAMKGDRDRYLKAGMDDYIAKPVKYDDLKNVISRLMERKKSGGLIPETPSTVPEVPEF